MSAEAKSQEPLCSRISKKQYPNNEGNEREVIQEEDEEYEDDQDFRQVSKFADERPKQCMRNIRKRTKSIFGWKNTLLSKIFKNIMKEGTFKKKIEVNNLAKVRKEIKDSKVITRWVGIEQPYVEEGDKKLAIQLQLQRMLQWQKEIVNTFKSISWMMLTIKKIGRQSARNWWESDDTVEDCIHQTIKDPLWSW
jgi:hypothetical protein